MTNNCESCKNYFYDDTYEEYICLVSMDEDDVYRLQTKQTKACPYYQSDDDYLIVRKQK